MLGLLPLVPLLATLAFPEIVSEPRVAQVRLAETLADADAIEAVTARNHTVTFIIVRGDDTLAVIARTTKRGDITSLAIAPATAQPALLHGLTWLAAELAEVTAVTRLTVDAHGAVTLATNDGRRYLAIGGGGANAASASRWAAAWSD